MAISDPKDFAIALLRRLNIEPNPGAIKALIGWQQAEGGHWHNTARYNPLNTTQNMPGSGDTGSQGNISVYKGWGQGVEATARTLTNGRYGNILSALKAGKPTQAARAIDQSPWGTHGSLVYRTIAEAKAGGASSGSMPMASPVGTPKPAVRTKVIPAVDNSSARAALISDYVSQGGADNENAVRALAMSLPAVLKDTPAKVRQISVPATGAPGDSFTPAGSAPDKLRVLIERASKIDAKHLPYVWGGGHAKSGKPDRGTGRDPGIGFDCSGAVAAVLGVNPRVSGQFAQWGKPGRGRNVTVYANGTHTFLEINGHFFGTSGTNPSGGAGWIPRSAMSQAYLSRFVARHPAGL